MAAEIHDASDHAPQYDRGEMEIVEQTSTYGVFDNLVRWGSLGVAALILFLTIQFCTRAGLIGALVPTLILVAVGGFALRKAPTSVDTH